MAIQYSPDNFYTSSAKSDSSQYRDFAATSLYCPDCGASMPVIEHLLLILPDGCIYEYRCRGCGAVLGEKRTSGDKNYQ